jgi:CxxC motif-containing protein (DUF1111 family)
MKMVSRAAFFSLALLLVSCMTPPHAAPPAGSPQLPPEAATGFDGESNGTVGAADHLVDQAKFDETEGIADGLGPLYNAQSCRECHQSPLSGGISQVLELRIGHKAPDGTFRNPEIPINGGESIIKGRSLVNSRAICPSSSFPDTNIQERVPSSETIRAFRASLNLLGDGLVEAVDDATLEGIAQKQCGSKHGHICGRALKVPVLESPGTTRVGRFGWKDQHASLLSFSGDAYLNEIGITNALFPDEVTTLCNTAAEPNDSAGPDGLTDIDHFSRFIRGTKAPARDASLASSAPAKKGETLFAKIGCDICHVPTLTTVSPGTVLNGGRLIVPNALGNKTFHPYGDFLLHDVGTGDGIVMAMQEHYGKNVYDTKWPQLSIEAFNASANRIRTTPLWGLRTHTTFMHDGASLTLHDAILRHGGEATAVTQRYARLSRADQRAIAAFLASL